MLCGFDAIEKSNSKAKRGGRRLFSFFVKNVAHSALLEIGN